MRTQLERKDWEEVKEIAETEIKAAFKVMELQTMILEIAEKKIKEFPKEKEKEKVKKEDKEKIY